MAGCRSWQNGSERHEAAKAIEVRFGVASAFGNFAGGKLLGFVVSAVEARFSRKQCRTS